jgi:malate synthase
MATTAQVVLKGANEGRSTEVLTSEALAFVARLQRQFGSRRLELLRQRDERQSRLDAGEAPQFLVDTQTVRKSDWRDAKAPRDLEDRRVEITGPTDL